MKLKVNVKKKYDIDFYNSLESEVREIISLQEFLTIENTSPDKLIHKIDEYARVTNFEGNNFDKTLHFIYSLDLDVDKIGKILSKTDYIKYEDIEDLVKENGWV